jgi:hypothetical protein
LFFFDHLRGSVSLSERFATAIDTGYQARALGSDS